MELVPALGAGGRAFKSPRPDQENQQFADHQLKHLHFEHQALPFQVNRICTLRDALCQNCVKTSSATAGVCRVTSQDLTS